MISLERRTVARSALLLICASLMACANASCGGQAAPAKPTLALSFSNCVYSGMLTMTPSSGTARVFTSGLCGGGAYDGASNGTGVDLSLSLGGTPGGDEALNLTFNAASANQTIAASAAPPDVASDNFLGAEVPMGSVWARHRVETSATPPRTYVSAQGSVLFGAIDIVAIDCTTDACEKGTASFDLSFQHVVWTTTNGQADLSGHVVVTTTAGGAYCSASTECHDAGFACNQVSYSNDDSQYPSSACGPTNASGVTLGAPCTSASDCASGYCDLHAGECAMFCSTDADCDDATRCVRSHWDAGVKECMRRCATDASCVDLPQAKRCVGHEAADSTQVVGACGGSTGTTQDGHTPTSAYGGSCETELQLSSNGECTRFCASNADCTAVLPVCGVTGVKRAQGDGTVAYAKACHS